VSGLPWNGFGPDPATRATVGDYQGQYVAMQEMRRHWLLTEIQVNRSNAATGGLASPESPFRSMWDLLSGFLFTRFAFLGFHPQIWMLLLAMSVATVVVYLSRS
jgi:hypothetical protein